MKSRRRNSGIFVLTLFLMICIDFLAADEFTWTAKRQWSRLSEGRELTVLSGGAVITSDATTIVADEIELWGTDFRYSMAKGAVTATDTERGIILKSDSLYYDREMEIIRVDGFIDMQDLKNDVVARGGFFEYYGEDEIAFIQIGVRILKVDEDNELACRSEFARYLRDDEILELSGMPHVTRNTDVYTAARITINLDTDEILLDRDVSGKIITEPEPEDAGDEQTEAGGSTGEDQLEGGAAAGTDQPEGDALTGDVQTQGGAPVDGEAQTQGGAPADGEPEEQSDGGAQTEESTTEPATGNPPADGVPASSTPDEDNQTDGESSGGTVNSTGEGEAG